MEKEPKKSAAESTSRQAETSDREPEAGSSPCESPEPHPGILREIGKEAREQVRPNQGYIKIDYFTLFWLFVAGSVFGLVVETAFHAIVYGGYESRAGLVWGPFSPIYGVGAAWGMFGDSTFLLGVMSLIVCVLLTVYLFFLAYRPNIVQVVGAALVVAGGLGNAFDRFALGYVVDFIEPVFIDFPVFNVADIGVTCGFVLFLVGVIVSWRHEDRLSAELAASDGEGEGTDAR